MILGSNKNSYILEDEARKKKKQVLEKQETFQKFLVINFCIFYSINFNFTKLFKNKIPQNMMKGTTCISLYQSLLLLYNIAIKHQEIFSLKIRI